MYTNYSFRPSMNGYYGIFYTVYSGSNRIVTSPNDGRSQETIFVEPSVTTNLSTISSQVLHLQNESNYISSQSREILHDTTYVSSQIKLKLPSLSSQVRWISSQTFSIHNDINGVSSNASLTKTITYNLSSQQIKQMHTDINFISSQVYWISSAAVDAATIALSSQSVHLKDELGYVSSQSREIWHDTTKISSQIFLLHNDINYISSNMDDATSPSVGFISSMVYWISSAMIDSSTLAGSSQASHLMAESNYISSQCSGSTSVDLSPIIPVINWISSNLESYGGGGGKSYNVYSKVLSPWNKETVKKVVDGVEKTKDTLDKLVKEEAKYHKDDEKRLEKLIQILDNILLTSVEKKDMKGVKESIDNAKKKLEEYRKDKSLDIDKLNKELVAIVKMLSLRMTDDELDKILESDIEEIK
jgi:hypothetical protein